MFTIPTLRSTIFFVVLWGVILAISTFALGADAVLVLSGLLLGALGGFMESQALLGMPKGLTNATADFNKRRSAMLATLPGKIFRGAELLSIGVAFVLLIVQKSASPFAIFFAFGTARHCAVLLSYILPKHSRRGNAA